VIDERRLSDPPRRMLVARTLGDLAGVTYRETAGRLGRSRETAAAAARARREALRTDPAYGALAADVVNAVVRRDFGPPRRLFDPPRTSPGNDDAPAMSGRVVWRTSVRSQAPYDAYGNRTSEMSVFQTELPTPFIAHAPLPSLSSAIAL
jgi:hypothetical protein